LSDISTILHAMVLLPKYYDELIRVRHHLHRIAEVSGSEINTSNYLREYLIKNAIGQCTELTDTGFLWSIPSGKVGPKVMFRAELDALPIAEVNEFDHRSLTPGVSHKCGHDGHMTILLGVIIMLSDQLPEIGSYHFLFQPAEETGTGASAILNSDAFKLEADYVFALHNLPGYPLHCVVCKQGSFNAAVTSLEIQITGKSSHAAEPENGVNPSMTIARILQLASQIEVPNMSAEDFSLVTPVHVRVGEKSYGVSPGDGELGFTLRAWTNDHLDKIKKSLIQSVSNVVEENGLTLNHEWKESFAATSNDKSAVELVQRAAESLNLRYTNLDKPFKWGEDFGLFTTRFRGALFGLGAGEDMPALHQPDYDFPDELIPTGVNLFLGLIDLVSEK